MGAELSNPRVVAISCVGLGAAVCLCCCVTHNRVCGGKPGFASSQAGVDRLHVGA